MRYDVPPGSRTVLVFLFLVGIPTGVWAAVMVVLGVVTPDAQGHVVTVWGLPLLALIYLAPVIAYRGWSRRGSRRQVILGLGLCLVPLAVNGVLTARVLAAGWYEVYAAVGLFVAGTPVLLRLLARFAPARG